MIELADSWECKNCNVLFAAYSSGDLSKMMSTHSIEGCDVKERRNDSTSSERNEDNSP